MRERRYIERYKPRYIGRYNPRYRRYLVRYRSRYRQRYGLARIQKSQEFWELLRSPERQTNGPSSSIFARERRYSERYERRYKRYFERYIRRFFGGRDG